MNARRQLGQVSVEFLIASIIALALLAGAGARRSVIQELIDAAHRGFDRFVAALSLAD